MGAFHVVKKWDDESEPRQHTTRIPIGVYREVVEYAKQNGISVNEAINRAVAQFMTASNHSNE